MPRVTAISPKFGSPTGGNVVTITGSGFDQNAPATVFFGTTAATDVTVINASTITAVSPAGTGTVDVTVVTFGGTSNTSTADQFTYTVNGPQVALTQRYGYHAQPTYLVISFTEALAPSSAQHAANYSSSGPNGQRIKVRSALYNDGHPRRHPDAGSAAKFADKLHLDDQWALTIRGPSSDGYFLDRGRHRRARELRHDDHE